MKNKGFKFLCSFLALIMVFYSIPLAANSVGDNPSADDGKLTDFSECRILDYVDNNEFLAANHRERLPQKEDLNSYVFKNYDGTETAYFMQDNVKYYDRDGIIREKNLMLEKTKNGYTPISNDVYVHFPNDISDGISVAFEGINISISPIDESFGEPKLSEDGKTVFYQATKNESLSLSYSPTLTGFKEDIVLNKYYGVNSFEFVVKTNGLGIYRDENGKLYVAKSKTDAPQAYFGDIIGIDSKGTVFFGNMSVKTVTDNQKYIMTVSVDEKTLIDEAVSYPVTIDPSVTIIYTNNPKTIHDTNVYSGPYAGTVDHLIFGAAASNVTSYALMSFPGVYNSYLYSGISKDSILSANLSLYCKRYTVTLGTLMGAIPCTGAFWDDNQAIYSTAGIDGDMSYLCINPMGAVGEYNTINITQIVKYWKDSYDSARKGLLLFLRDSRDYAFYASSNNANANHRPYLTIQYSTINQGFRHEFCDYVPVAFKNKSTSKVMRSYSDTLYQFEDNTSDVTRQFKIKRYIDGRYAIENSDGLNVTALDTENLTFTASLPAGPGLNNNQTWYIVKTEDGYYQIISYTNQEYCLAASSSANGELVLTTNRSSDLSKWSIEFRKNVLRVFVRSNDSGASGSGEGLPGATVELFKAGVNGAFATKNTNDGGYAFFDNLSASATNYGITASKSGYSRKSYLHNNNPSPVSFSGGGNGSGSFDASITISSFDEFPTLLYPLSVECLPPLLSLNQQYGWRKNNSSLSFHNGIDISRIPVGDSYQTLGGLSVAQRPDVRSIAEGEVVQVQHGCGGSTGRFVAVKYTISDNSNEQSYSIVVRYLHLASVNTTLSVGATIDANTFIGKPGGSGSSENTYGVHLHIDAFVVNGESAPQYSAQYSLDPNVFFKQQ